MSHQLTAAQLITLRDDILANPDLSSQPNTPDGAFEIANLYNLQKTPPFTVWRSLVPIEEAGAAFVATSLAALQSADNDRLGTFALWNPTGVTPWRPDHRAFFDNIFGAAAGAPTRTALLALWKRLASRAEALFATGTGTDAVPAQLVFEGRLDYQTVQEARNAI